MCHSNPSSVRLPAAAAFADGYLRQCCADTRLNRKLPFNNGVKTLFVKAMVVVVVSKRKYAVNS